MLATDLKTGVIFSLNNQPYKVVKYTHSKVARGGANVKVKARNLITSSLIDLNYKGNDKVEDADVFKKNVQYIYFDGKYVFMDLDNYTQFSLSEDVVGEDGRFLKEGSTVIALYFEGSPVSIEIQKTEVFEVTYTEPGYKGNTVSTVYKDATLDNGEVVKVPSFIKIGDKIKVDTKTGEYVSKA